MDEQMGAPPIAAPLADVTTARLSLTRLVEGDLGGLAAVFSEPEVWRYPFGRAFSRTESQMFVERQIAHWEDLGFGLWVTRTNDDDRVIGYIGLSVPRFLPEILPAVEVGWRLSPSAWGQGYATEGATAALDQAFTTLGLERVCSLPQADNPASTRVCERLGMPLLRDVTIPDDGRRGELVVRHYEIERDAWLAGRRPG